MDVFLMREAHREIKTLRIVCEKKPQDGLLIGHSRGPRFFIEKIWPTEIGFFSGEEQYWEIEEIFQGRVIGFFSYLPQLQRHQKLLQPLACGKVFLEIYPRKNKTMTMKCFILSFDGSFYASPCPLQTEAEGES